MLVYYGLSLGVSRLGTNLYLTQFVFGVVEIPARTLVLLVLPFSRRLCQSGFLTVGGLACLLMLAVPAGQTPFTRLLRVRKGCERQLMTLNLILILSTCRCSVCELGR